MHEQTLIQAGLSKNQAILYEVLLKTGQTTAGKLASASPLKRGLTYKTLDELTGLGLVEKREESGKVAQFLPLHPMKLKDLAEQREKDAKNAQTVLEGTLPMLISDFNLISGKPGITLFEGDEGILKVTYDSLTAKSEIYSYVDIEAVETYAHRENQLYVAKRQRLAKAKKILVTNSPFNRAFFEKLHPSVTDVRYMDFPFPSFHTAMQIYDNRVSYVTLDDHQKIGMIIDNAHIAAMHRALFEYAWSHAIPAGKQSSSQTPHTPLSDVAGPSQTPS